MAVVVIAVLVALSFYFAPLLQVWIGTRYNEAAAIVDLRGLILGLGTSLIGAAAIVTSLVLFALQVNVERMPHGLFRRLSEDRRLLAAFALAFLLAIGVAFLSAMVDAGSIAVPILATAWSVMAILLLFLYAYRRALILINPLKQLEILVEDTRRDLSSWVRRVRRAAPLLERTQSAEDSEVPSENLVQSAFFWINKHWADSARKSIEHAMSFARRYVEHGDYEVAEAALGAVVRINSEYISAKGNTFYAHNPFFETGLSADDFINGTLEHLRRHSQTAIARRDEEQIEQTMRALSNLVDCYLQIEYPGAYTQKTHALLASGYLGNTVESVVPHGMPDVLLEGQRLLGRSARVVLRFDQPESIATLVDKIALIACTGCAREDYRPVTMEGMSQLSILTLDLIQTRSHDPQFVLDEVRRNVELVGTMFLKVKDTPLSRIHSTFLGPYYSSTTQLGLRARLTALANAISDSDVDDSNAQTVIHNLELWADDLYQTQEKLLLASIEARSNFTFDIIHWIAGVAEILLAVSNAPACRAHDSEELRSHATWLLGTLTWVPDDEQAIRFVENSQLTEVLFRSAVDAYNRGLEGVAKEVGRFLLSWTYKGGKQEVGWGVLERGLCACAVLAARAGEGQALEESVREMNEKLLVDPNLRLRVADVIREKADRVGFRGRNSSSIEYALSQADPDSLGPLLRSLADLLSEIDTTPPATSG